MDENFVLANTKEKKKGGLLREGGRKGDAVIFLEINQKNKRNLLTLYNKKLERKKLNMAVLLGIFSEI